MEMVTCLAAKEGSLTTLSRSEKVGRFPVITANYTNNYLYYELVLTLFVLTATQFLCALML